MGREEQAIRALRYRLRRQGMLELDLWLGRLDRPEVWRDPEARKALAKLMAAEPPVLVEFMQGRRALPPVLARWLGEG